MSNQSCDGDKFLPDLQFGAGLRKISLDQATTFKANYQKLLDVLTSEDPTAGGQLPPEALKQVLAVQGYYLGKEQLSCLIKKDFKDFRGLHIRLGLTEDPLEGRSFGSLVYLVQGTFGATTADRGTETIGGTKVDKRFKQKSKAIYMAGHLPEPPTPDPVTYPDPPYGQSIG